MDVYFTEILPVFGWFKLHVEMSEISQMKNGDLLFTGVPTLTYLYLLFIQHDEVLYGLRVSKFVI